MRTWPRNLSTSQGGGLSTSQYGGMSTSQYRIETGRVEVLRILHDSRDLAQHVPPAV
jgi:plasmid stabilization system protein ParE